MYTSIYIIEWYERTKACAVDKIIVEMVVTVTYYCGLWTKFFCLEQFSYYFTMMYHVIVFANCWVCAFDRKKYDPDPCKISLEKKTHPTVVSHVYSCPWCQYTWKRLPGVLIHVRVNNLLVTPAYVIHVSKDEYILPTNIFHVYSYI